MNPADAVGRAAQQIAPIPRGDDGAPVFAAPWEAQAFAMTLALQERGLFTWSEWAAALGIEIQRAQTAGDPDDGSTYYRHWLSAIERLVMEKDVVDPTQLEERRAAWTRAARATPHGQPVILDNDPRQ